MTDYIKTTDFAAKDTLPSGDTNKVIRGSEFDAEFNAIETASATKADTADPSFTGTVDVAGDITLTGTVDGRDVAADGAKLDGVAPNAEANAVDSVNTQTGAVVLDADDISDAATTNKFTTAGDISKLAGKKLALQRIKQALRLRLLTNLKPILTLSPTQKKANLLVLKL